MDDAARAERVNVQTKALYFGGGFEPPLMVSITVDSIKNNSFYTGRMDV
jgi:hypothetical protein